MFIPYLLTLLTPEEHNEFKRRERMLKIDVGSKFAVSIFLTFALVIALMYGKYLGGVFGIVMTCIITAGAVALWMIIREERVDRKVYDSLLEKAQNRMKVPMEMRAADMLTDPSGEMIYREFEKNFPDEVHIFKVYCAEENPWIVLVQLCGPEGDHFETIMYHAHGDPEFVRWDWNDRQIESRKASHDEALFMMNLMGYVRYRQSTAAT